MGTHVDAGPHPESMEVNTKTICYTVELQVQGMINQQEKTHCGGERLF